MNFCQVFESKYSNKQLKTNFRGDNHAILSLTPDHPNATVHTTRHISLNGENKTDHKQPTRVTQPVTCYGENNSQLENWRILTVYIPPLSGYHETSMQ